MKDYTAALQKLIEARDRDPMDLIVPPEPEPEPEPIPEPEPAPARDLRYSSPLTDKWDRQHAAEAFGLGKSRFKCKGSL